MFRNCDFRLFICVVLSCHQCSAQVQPDYHWTFDQENDLITYNSKSSVGDSGSLLNGSDIVASTERYGKVAYFSGQNSGISIDNSSSCIVDVASCSNGLSFSFWVKFVKFGPEAIISSPGVMIKHLTSTTLPVEIWDGSKGWLIFYQRNLALDNIWQQYTVTWDRSLLKVFVNGVLGSSMSGTKPARTFVESSPVAKRLAVGISTKLTTNEKQEEMLLDDLKIWEKNLSGEEVMSIYKEGIYNPNVYMLEDISNSIQFSSMGFNVVDEITLAGVTISVRTVDECFTRCSTLQQCQSVGYKPNNSGNSTCTIFEYFLTFNEQQRDNNGIYYYSVHRN